MTRASPLRAVVVGAGWAGEGHTRALQFRDGWRYQADTSRRQGELAQPTIQCYYVPVVSITD